MMTNQYEYKLLLLNTVAIVYIAIICMLHIVRAIMKFSVICKCHDGVNRFYEGLDY